MWRVKFCNCSFRWPKKKRNETVGLSFKRSFSNLVARRNPRHAAQRFRCPRSSFSYIWACFFFFCLRLLNLGRVSVYSEIALDQAETRKKPTRRVLFTWNGAGGWRDHHHPATERCDSHFIPGTCFIRSKIENMNIINRIIRLCSCLKCETFLTLLLVILNLFSFKS